MKQLVILSGKGGTGKTCVAAAFAHLAHCGPGARKAVLADADVDAANLELVLHPSLIEEHRFFGGAVAIIDETLCQGCGTCEQVCRFEAVLPLGSYNGVGYNVDPISCDGCAACVYQCPEQAIHMEIQLAGRWIHSQSRYGSLLHAELYPAQENSGKLVTLVKQQARLHALDSGAGLLIVDGPPGIGCPVISASSGADLVLIIAEPTAAGIHDMNRVVQMAHHFRVPVLVVINKADIYPEGAEQIVNYCHVNHIQIAGSIPFDKTVTEAMVHGEPVTAYMSDAPSSLALISLWKQVIGYLDGQKESI
jgi:MinD superfamily P-loop ATPase